MGNQTLVKCVLFYLVDGFCFYLAKPVPKNGRWLPKKAWEKEIWLQQLRIPILKLPPATADHPTNTPTPDANEWLTNGWCSTLLSAYSVGKQQVVKLVEKSWMASYLTLYRRQKSIFFLLWSDPSPACVTTTGLACFTEPVVCTENSPMEKSWLLSMQNFTWLSYLIFFYFDSSLLKT